jgi:hypothetical protein
VVAQPAQAAAQAVDDGLGHALTRYNHRFGVRVETDAVFEAWAGVDLGAKRAALRVPTNPVDRHHLLQSLVDQLARQAIKQPDLTEELLVVAELHLHELPRLLAELQRDDELNRAARGMPAKRYVHPAVSAFGVLESIYSKRGDRTALARVLAAKAAMAYNPFP